VLVAVAVWVAEGVGVRVGGAVGVAVAAAAQSATKSFPPDPVLPGPIVTLRAAGANTHPAAEARIVYVPAGRLASA
jgi:hypothetical protein